MRLPRLALLAVLVLAACGDDATSSRDALGRYVAIGGSATAGFASDGLVYDGQSRAYPALVARAGGARLVEARVQAPGCVPPLVAPLFLDRTLSGRRAFTAPGDTTCAGRFASDSVLAQNVAVPEMTTYQALRFTPDSVTRLREPRARRAIAEILRDGYSQTTQATLIRPSVVTVELGFGDIVRAIRSGQIVTATDETYRADTGFTYAPLSVWRPVYDSLIAALADSAGVRRAVLLRVPRPDALPALRLGSALHAARDSLRVFGVVVAADCDRSPNYVHLVKVAVAAAAAVRAGAAQAVSCANVPGAVDSVLTPLDMTTLVELRNAMNAHIESVAQQRGWATVLVEFPVASMETYDARTHLASDNPFGMLVSADGLHPSPSGHVSIADAIIAALNETFGLAIPRLITDEAS